LTAKGSISVGIGVVRQAGRKFRKGGCWCPRYRTAGFEDHFHVLLTKRISPPRLANISRHLVLLFGRLRAGDRACPAKRGSRHPKRRRYHWPTPLFEKKTGRTIPCKRKPSPGTLFCPRGSGIKIIPRAQGRTWLRRIPLAALMIAFGGLPAGAAMAEQRADVFAELGGAQLLGQSPPLRRLRPRRLRHRRRHLGGRPDRAEGRGKVVVLRPELRAPLQRRHAGQEPGRRGGLHFLFHPILTAVEKR
jgi:hypothetical protein